ncbi:NAD(P)/FAD-dependent oxidoreductase [Permianibacter aggregans]|uniref:Gamma-glutamylputrescine oxidase n=1 Tax=Permianibacter aggregans TaxID=1510150 RepID=A0A4V3D8B6_9GAMM|nr:FAD-binding oxidoreductase [Permianibacter aggregans]QGX41360.1 FAD-binding oxidoreductase [Permianibacter aggregans]TDQ51147.1 gamma-glutamylputrescine oxidase [Permianibacter aggregans]
MSAHAPSWYAASANSFPSLPSLDGDRNVDVCIIGAGMTGCAAALDLAERGYKVLVLEAERVGWGASGRSGGQFIHDYACGNQTLQRLVGKTQARQHWQLSIEALVLLRKRVADHGIDCDLRDGFCAAAIKPRQQRALEQEQEFLQQTYDYPTELWTGERLREQVNSPRYIAGLFDARSGHLHPLNYTLGLASAARKAGADIVEQTRALSLQHGSKVQIRTDRGTVTADFVVLAANAYLGKLAPQLDRKIMPVGTYIMATEPLGPERAESLIRNDICVCDTNFVLDYFRRSADHRLLFGGRVSYSKLEPRNLTERLCRHMLRVFPQLHDIQPAYTWGGYVDITMNRAPHFGRLQPNVFFAQGFSGHGVALTGMAGRLIADAISGQAERFDMFARIPHHNFPGGTMFRTPALVLAMAWYRLRDLL